MMNAVLTLLESEEFVEALEIVIVWAELLMENVLPDLVFAATKCKI